MSLQRSVAPIVADLFAQAPVPPASVRYALAGDTGGPRALEDDSFPFEALSDVAEVESWRKEINRPLTHIHKWWAQRLGTVFRAMVIGAFAPKGADVLDLFYEPTRVMDGTVFDPFMGSGTTIGEAAKLGARAIGRDINPVAHFLVRNALARHDRKAIERTYRVIERKVADQVRQFYKTRLPDGSEAEVLYFFWVKAVDCPCCAASVDLFSSRIFAQHAYAKRYPTSQALCPHCDEVNEVQYGDTEFVCRSCRQSFNPQTGPARGQKATCPRCDHEFPIAKTVRDAKTPPAHRLYAKLVLHADGRKSYQRATDVDHALFSKAKAALAHRENAYPVVAIEPGYNTNQVLGYNYRYWHDMFNERQLLSLSILADEIRTINDPVLRDLFTCLFSGVLEFNNLFASYKGEGTGAVRHMFAHHILKPERVPLEANVWGTPKSSGSFSTMFEGRLKRALDYADDPFEIRVSDKSGRKSSEKIYGLSDPIGVQLANSFDAFGIDRPVYLSCGDSGATDIATGSVDAVLTDPPFFDNVHYSQLADFFHVWQRHILGAEGSQSATTTRSDAEVQHGEVATFTERLGHVWREAYRVLKDDGIFAFTYHHSRAEGWNAVLAALMKAGFVITAAQPIKAEMSVAMPKQQAKEPIDLDIIVVCRKRGHAEAPTNGDLWSAAARQAELQVTRLAQAGRRLSRNDVRIIVMAQQLRLLSFGADAAQACKELQEAEAEITGQIARLYTLAETVMGGR
ncbi:DNA methyltransferase (plasmid) [Segnochrobactraceae bacterium EtOH-i3]